MPFQKTEIIHIIVLYLLQNLKMLIHGLWVNQDQHKILTYLINQLNPAFSWKDAEYIINEWGNTGPVALKGVVRPDDAKIACECASTFNKNSYYIDIDFDEEICKDDDEALFFDIYGSVTVPEVCDVTIGDYGTALQPCEDEE